MSDSFVQRWIVKLEDGRIAGPYDTKKVLDKIAKGVYSGAEQISKYPGGEWISISSQPEFYDLLLTVLSGEIVDVREDEASSWVADSASHLKSKESEAAASASAELTDQTFDKDSNSSENSESVSELELEKTRIVPRDSEDDDLGLDEDDHFFESTKKIERDPIDDFTMSQTKKRKRTKKRKKAHESEKSSAHEDIELVSLRKQNIQEKIEQYKWPILIIVGFLFLGLYFASLPSPEKRGGLRLKKLNFNSAEKLDKDNLKRRIAAAVGDYLKDQLDDYRAAESQLVKLIPSDPKNLNLYGILCLTQFEIWPATRQSSADIEAIEQVIRSASTVNPTDLYTFTCKASSLILQGKIAEATDFVEEILASFRGSKSSPIPFYYFKALLLANAKDYQTAVGYANSARTLWPQWLRAYILEASLHMKAGDYTSAYQILSGLHKSNNDHPTTKTLLGIIEFLQFGKADRALAFLRSGLRDADQIPRDIAAEGFLTLSNIHMKENNPSDALKAAQQSYRLDPTNESTKNLILRLGNKETLGATAIKAHELMLEGDQFVRQGDCQSAQAHYKSAFDLDNKLGSAAFKASKCLWEVSFSTEAIQWMKKAIRADPKLIDAYVMLADFYSRRFDFVSAAQTLNAASRVSSKSHKVLRGYALIELRRKNAKAAISFSKQALLIYPNDIESMLVLCEAYLLSRSNTQDAFASAAKAIELDSSNKEAQITYAKSLARLQGIDFGVEHLLELIRRYPLAEAYRQALGDLYLEDERYSDAEAVYRQLIEIQDKPKTPLMQLGRVLKLKGLYQQALDTFFRAAVYDPSDAEPFYEAGILLLDFKKPVEAKKQFGRVLLTNEKFPLIHYQMGRAELLLNNPKGALRQADKEKRANPNLPFAYMLSADAHHKLKQYSLCAQDYQQAIKLQPQGASSYIKAAACYRLSGSLDSSDSMLRIAARQESGNPGIYREQGALFEARGDFEKAIAAYQEYFILDPNAPDRNLIEKRIRRFGR